MRLTTAWANELAALITLKSTTDSQNKALFYAANQVAKKIKLKEVLFQCFHSKSDQHVTEAPSDAKPHFLTEDCNMKFAETHPSV